MTQSSNKYNLEERTTQFGREVIKFCKTIRPDIVKAPIISQLIRSGTSIGANYQEAVGASSKRDFRNKIYLCKKESQETKYWLNMIIEAESFCENKAILLRQEAQELILIFGKIVSTMDNKKKINQN